MGRLSNDSFIWRELQGGLWHTTHPSYFQRILTLGAILPEPDIPESNRWKTSRGPDYHSYVRTIGGVSLFDFDGFQPEKYNKKYPLSNWEYFVPYRKDWQSAVWIEINRAQVADRFISSTELVERWKAKAAFHHSIMPYIEAAYLGELKRSAFIRAFIVEAGKELCLSVPSE
jgi:hypothetical protein